MMKLLLRGFGAACAVMLVVLMAVSCSPAPEIDLAASPNILLIITDDQRYDTMFAMPRTQELIFDQGVEFNKAYTTTARCCPSRASIFTGMYAHNHGVLTNDMPLDKRTFVQTLDSAGYYTGVIGKYLNSYPTNVSDRPRPEFDVWNVYPGNSTGSPYFDITMNIDGKVQLMEGYQTYILRDLAVSFIEDASQREEPFLLLFNPFAPHLPAKPALGDDDLYLDLEAHRPASFNEEDMSDKPEWLAGQPLLSERAMERVDNRRLHQLQSLHSLDMAIEDIIQELERQGELDNTIIIYMSDNGLFWGEHRLDNGKIWVYEPSTHVPFSIRYPAAIDKPFKTDALVANIDIAPTLFDLLGLPTQEEMDGRSLMPLLRGEAVAWRDYLLIEGWPVQVRPVEYAPFFQAIHTGRYVYVETEGDITEFYDLFVDPYQIDSQPDNPEYADIISNLQHFLEEERKSIPPVDADQLHNASGD
jgi:N-acetylglucosamine-6-sulfatase